MNKAHGKNNKIFQNERDMTLDDIFKMLHKEKQRA